MGFRADRGKDGSILRMGLIHIRKGGVIGGISED